MERVAVLMGILLFLYATWMSYMDIQEIKSYVKEMRVKNREEGTDTVPTYVYPWWRHSYHNLWRPSSVYYTPHYGFYRSPFWLY